MSNDFNNRTLAVSLKIYKRLLLTYPKAHREEYGPAMAQLFHDQCRDAWRESSGWGLTKLWLRVLPDLIKTSFIERLAALTQRKSMADKMASLIQPRIVFWKVFAVVFLLVLCYSTTVSFLLPETYASTSKMLLRGSETYDPYVIQTQFEIINSEAVLVPVIDRLNLNAVWGKKYLAGKSLKTPETLEILKQSISLLPVRNTMLMSITVFSGNKNEAAQIANAIAESYKSNLFAQAQVRSEETAKKMDALMKPFDEQDAQIESLRSRVELLRQQFNISKEAIEPQSSQEQPYWDARRNLEEFDQLHKEGLKLLNVQLSNLQTSDRHTAGFPSAFAIIEKATPGRIPVRPNKALNIMLGGFWGILLAGAIGGGAAFIASKIRRRSQVTH